jgi:hypothetical protein
MRSSNLHQSMSDPIDMQEETLMDAISILKNEYPGDEAWVNYLSVFADNLDAQDDKSQYLAVIPDKQLAAILAVKMGKNATIWFSSPCPALEKRTPKDVFENEPMGGRVLRTLLMRMPI